MTRLPTLRRELIVPLVALSAGSLYAGLLATLALVPYLPPDRALLYVALLLVVVVALFAWLAAIVLRRRLLQPVEQMINAVERVSAGASIAQLPDPRSRDMQRLSAAVAQMAERLTADQEALAANIESLDETNRLLTEARDAMVRTEKMASVGRLSSGIAHEIGNPLGAIIGYLALLGRTDGARQAEFLAAAQREAQRIDRIVRGLLDFARPRDAVVQQVDLNNVISETVDLVQTQGRFSGVSVEVTVPEAPAMVEADPYQLQQVLVNLIVNATDAMEGSTGRRLQVSCARRAMEGPVQEMPARRKEDPPGINYSHRRRLAAAGRNPVNDPETASGDVIDIFVRDSGPGIPSELLDQVFEPFVTTKDPGRGTGLGLAVCARIVESMGGVIRVRNVEPHGAEFQVIVPALDVERQA